ncbi:MAG: thioredoxin domain-containing protein [Actinomycetota bacterium]|nr:thioredoxin domain-containing protein [Actinomycetota bacterium]
MTNRLSLATSPYLQQHATNPVHWWEWSDAAFAEASRRDLPIFLSIGYSACHWCHVMAHESFEDINIANFLNEHFISIKVDREERPDIDAVYMQATVALTGHGGWPMSVLLDQEGRPFYAGTYFPPTPHHGLPSFMQVLHGIQKAWAERRTEIYTTAVKIIESLQTPTLQSGALPSAEDFQSAVTALVRDFDSVNGGFGNAPKFPPSMLLEFLLREHARSGNSQALTMAERTLTAMARGGIYDQLGGGFSRYSVDSKWVVPHFEKMLYDNALLLRVYTHWWRISDSELARRIVYETVEFMLRELRTDQGAFASALDADTEGAEGTYYVWSIEKLIDVLGECDGRWASEVLHVTGEGSFEHGLSTLQLLNDPSDQVRWSQIKQQLFTARNLRPRPNRDDKVVAAWNGLAIAAIAEAGVLFSQTSWIAAAESAADLIAKVHLNETGQRLLRTSRDGMAGSSWGVLDDYANVAEGFLALYQVSGVEKWILLAGKFLDTILLHFDDSEDGFFDTADDAPSLVGRPKSISDNAEPAGWLASANALLTYAALTGENNYRIRAEAALAKITPLIARAPRAIGWGLVAATALLDGPRQVAIIGPAGEASDELWHRAWKSTAPGAVIARASPNVNPTVGLLKNRPMVGDHPTAYVCRGFVCELPTTDPTELTQILRK